MFISSIQHLLKQHSFPQSSFYLANNYFRQCYFHLIKSLFISLLEWIVIDPLWGGLSGEGNVLGWKFPGECPRWKYPRERSWRYVRRNCPGGNCPRLLFLYLPAASTLNTVHHSRPSVWLSKSWTLPIDFVFVKRLRCCGRFRNLELTITITNHRR